MSDVFAYQQTRSRDATDWSLDGIARVSGWQHQPIGTAVTEFDVDSVSRCSFRASDNANLSFRVFPCLGEATNCGMAEWA